MSGIEENGKFAAVGPGKRVAGQEVEQGQGDKPRVLVQSPGECRGEPKSGWSDTSYPDPGLIFTQCHDPVMPIAGK